MFVCRLVRVVTAPKVSAEVTVSQPGIPPLEFTVPDGKSIVGRDPGRCQLVIGKENPGEDAVSRVHCSIEFSQNTGSAAIVDLDSRNGVLVNAQKTRQASLAHGDTIQLGPILFEVQIFEPGEGGVRDQLTRVDESAQTTFSN